MWKLTAQLNPMYAFISWYFNAPELAPGQRQKFVVYKP